MSRTLIYLIGIFALWFYFHIADAVKPEKDDGFNLGKADKAQSGHGGLLTSHDSGFAVKPYNGIGGTF